MGIISLEPAVADNLLSSARRIMLRQLENPHSDADEALYKAKHAGRDRIDLSADARDAPPSHMSEIS